MEGRGWEGKAIMNLKDKLVKARNDRNFVKLFLNEKDFILASDKSVLVKIDDIKFGVAQKMVMFKEVSKNGKEYCSITINRNGEYQTFRTRKLANNKYEDFDQRTMTGQELLTYYFRPKK